jgi:hypothetical protein
VARFQRVDWVATDLPIQFSAPTLEAGGDERPFGSYGPGGHFFVHCARSHKYVNVRRNGTGT